MGLWGSDVQYSVHYVQLASPTQMHTHLHMVNPIKPSIPVKGLVLTQVGSWKGEEMGDGWLY